MWPPLIEAQIEMLLVFLTIAVLFVGIPTVGIYREASEHSDQPYVWTTGMFVLSIVTPLIGPVVLWLLYTSLEVRE